MSFLNVEVDMPPSFFRTSGVLSMLAICAVLSDVFCLVLLLKARLHHSYSCV